MAQSTPLPRPPLFEKPMVIEAMCVGVTPMLMNPKGKSILEELRTGVRRQIKKDRPADDVAKERVIRADGDGSAIGIPTQYLLSALTTAGEYVDFKGKKRFSTKITSLVGATIVIEESFLPFIGNNGGDIPWVTDMRGGRLPKDGTAVCLVRPLIPAYEWGFKVRLVVDASNVSESKAHELLDKAGQFIGIGDFRPSCRGNHGQFRVVEWNVVSDASKAKSAKQPAESTLSKAA